MSVDHGIIILYLRKLFELIGLILITWPVQQLKESHRVNIVNKTHTVNMKRHLICLKSNCNLPFQWTRELLANLYSALGRYVLIQGHTLHTHISSLRISRSHWYCSLSLQSTQMSFSVCLSYWDLKECFFKTGPRMRNTTWIFKQDSRNSLSVGLSE